MAPCGRHGTLWHSNTFHQVSKVVMCDRHNTFGSFSEDELHFSWQAQHDFGDLHPHFAWQARHFRRVVLRVFCESHFQRCVKCLQIPWQASHFVTCVENWRKPRTKHRFWGSWFRSSCGKFVGKRRFCSYKVWKFEEFLHKMFILSFQHVSSRFSGVVVASLCLCGKLQHLSFSKVSNEVIMSFCVAGVSLCDIRTGFKRCRKSFMRNTSASCSKNVVHFSWQAQHSGRVQAGAAL